MKDTEFKSYNTISPAIQEQLNAVRGIWEKHLGDKLTGIYLHGSLALGCFMENVSDLDMLIVTDRPISRGERLAIAREIIAVDKSPCPLEMSAILQSDLIPWQYPTPCQFHYSDYWTERYGQLLSGEITESFIVDTDFTDADIASYVKLTVQCGIRICGKPVSEVFPEVPDRDFWRSISADIDDYDFHAYNPRYFASNILILGRILSYKEEKRILSKYDGGLWTVGHIPERYRYIAADALRVWYEGKEPDVYSEADLKALRDYLIGRIKA